MVGNTPKTHNLTIKAQLSSACPIISSSTHALFAFNRKRSFIIWKNKNWLELFVTLSGSVKFYVLELSKSTWVQNVEQYNVVTSRDLLDWISKWSIIHDQAETVCIISQFVIYLLYEYKSQYGFANAMCIFDYTSETQILHRKYSFTSKIQFFLCPSTLEVYISFQSY